MGYFKIRNITSQLSKRHAKFNSTQIVEINNNFKIEKITIASDNEFLLETNFLPISLHKLRTEGLISIVELDKNTYHKLVGEQDANEKKLISQSQPQLIENKDVEESTDAEDKIKKYPSKITKKEK